MIISLNGTLADKHANRVVIETGGLGYEVGVSVSCSAELPSVGSIVRLHIHHQFTESDQRLFGFLRAQEKRLFELLITVKGVGPKLALTVLSGLDEAGISKAIATQDLATLSRIPGIGRKTAERIVLELRDKMDAGSDGGMRSGSDPDARSEAVAALEALGYKRVDAEKAIAGAIQEGADAGNAGELVKRGLRLVTLR
jgi:holliday junction DNA helicase RuvA